MSNTLRLIHHADTLAQWEGPVVHDSDIEAKFAGVPVESRVRRALEELVRYVAEYRDAAVLCVGSHEYRIQWD